MSGSNAWDIDSIMDNLKNTLSIAIVFSGDPEAPDTVVRRTFNYRAWASYFDVAQDIVNTLRALGYTQISLLAEGMNLVNALRSVEADLVWLNTGGVQGYDSMAHAAALMESCGLIYIGHRPLTYLIADSKPEAKEKLQAWGIPTPAFLFFEEHEPINVKRLQPLRAPYVVKPQNGSMSRYVRYAENARQACEVIEEVRAACRSGVLVEEFVDGIEITVAVMGSFYHDGDGWREHDKPLILPPLERCGKQGKIFPPITSVNLRHYTRPYYGPEGFVVKQTALKVWRAFRCRTVIRVDMILHSDGTPYVLEVNPKPDLKAPEQDCDSFVNIAAATIGWDYRDVIKTILYDRVYHILAEEPEGSWLLKKGSLC